MSKIVKNLLQPGNFQNFAGVMIDGGSQYEIPENELLSFQKSEILFESLTSLTATASIFSTESSTELTGPDAIRFLIDFGKITQTESTAFSSKLLNGKSLFKRLHSGDSENVNPYIDIAPGSSEAVEIEIGYPWAKIEAMEIVGAGKKHSASLWVLDTETNTYSQAPVNIVGPNYELNQFSFNSCVSENFHRFHSEYDADLYLGMIVRVEIFNYSTIQSSVGLNIELNEVR